MYKAKENGLLANATHRAVMARQAAARLEVKGLFHALYFDVLNLGAGPSAGLAGGYSLGHRLPQPRSHEGHRVVFSV